MFSRNAQPPAPEPQRTAPAPATPPGVRDVSMATPAATQGPSTAAPMPTDLTLIARADKLEGTLKVTDTLRIQGSVEGSIEATTVFIDEGAKVRADITADEVIIGGDYSGKLTCRQRLEIRATGQIVGQVETFRLMLHEGGSIDGELKMLKQPANGEHDLSGRGGPGRTTREPGPRSTVVAVDPAAAPSPANGQSAAALAAAGAEPIG